VLRRPIETTHIIRPAGSARLNLVKTPFFGSFGQLGYNRSVRRLIGITLLLFFSVPLISPLLALSASSEANLPVCCRRNGAHHCTPPLSMKSSSSGENVSAIPQRCPAFPAVVTQVRHSDLSFHLASLIFAEIVSHPSVKTQTLARARVALDSSCQKRGPPADLL
jgi:hypothetical protein